MTLMKTLRSQTYKVLRALLQYFRKEEITSSPEEKDLLWARIQTETIRQRKMRQRRILYLSTYAAAAVALFLTIGMLVARQFGPDAPDNWLEAFALQTDSTAHSTHADSIQLRLADGKEMLIPSHQTVTYSSGNTILVGTDTVYSCAEAKKREKQIDRIITPTGRQAQVILSDGTRLWVNANTKVAYPHRFKKDLREIFVDGEVYLEVAHNKKAPFFVRTKDFSVQVLGTKFNVSSYASASSASVVLVEGSVKVENDSRETTVLSPNQLLRIQDGSLSTPVKVDVSQYICWTDHLLMYEEKPLQEVLTQLEHYYGKKFVMRKDIKKDIRISGKLELKDRLDKVLHTLSFSFPVTFREEGDTVWVMNNKNN